MNKPSKSSQPKFAQIENRVLDLLEQDILTKTERRLFWYLFKLERFGDRFANIPSQGDIAKHLGVRRETINIAQAKLQKLGLFDFQIDVWRVRNCVAPKSHTVLDKSLRVLEKSNRVLDSSHSELEQSNSDTYIERAHVQTISDSSQTYSNLSHSEGDENLELEEEVSTPSLALACEFSRVQSKNETLGCDKNSATAAAEMPEAIATQFASVGIPVKPVQGQEPLRVAERIRHVEEGLLRQLHDLGVPLHDSEVIEAIAIAHKSQINGAIAEIKNTTVQSPKRFFLFKVKRLAVEPMGPLLPVRTEAEFRKVQREPPPIDVLNDWYKQGGRLYKTALSWASKLGYLITDRGIEEPEF